MRSLILLFSLLFIACIVNAQNVGINTTTPETKLHVVDVFDVADGASGTFINVQNATLFSPIGTLTGIRFRTDGVNTGGSNHRYKGAILFEKTGSFGVGSLHFVINGVASNTSVTTSDIKMTINSAGKDGVLW